jgi:hypothetical protein
MLFESKQSYKTSASKQLAAFQAAGVTRFKTQLVFGATPSDAPREPKYTATHKPKILDATGVMNNLSYWAARNLEGFNVFIAPAAHEDGTYAPLVFVDDILFEMFPKIHADKISPMVSIKSSPHKWQGWIQLNEPHLKAEDIRSVQRYLVAKYGFDGGAIGAEQNGRLAGYRNCKADYQETRVWCLLEKADASIVARSSLLAEAQEFERQSKPSGSKSVEHETVNDARDTFTADLAYLYATVRSSRAFPSDSELDWHFCLQAYRKGWNPADVVQSILELSGNLTHRKRDENLAQSYAERTAYKAWNEFQKNNRHS